MNTKIDSAEVARDYYDSSDADNFYYRVWGGQDIHTGIYVHEKEDIKSASIRTVSRMTSRLNGKLKRNSLVLDLGCGYG